MKFSQLKQIMFFLLIRTIFSLESLPLKNPPTMWHPNSMHYTHLQVSLQCERFSLFCGRLGYGGGCESGYGGCSVATAGPLPAQRSGRCHNSEPLYQMNQHPAGNSTNHHHSTPIWPTCNRREGKRESRGEISGRVERVGGNKGVWGDSKEREREKEWWTKLLTLVGYYAL